jgi:hypothetical protein
MAVLGKYISRILVRGHLEILLPIFIMERIYQLFLKNVRSHTKNVFVVLKISNASVFVCCVPP